MNRVKNIIGVVAVLALALGGAGSYSVDTGAESQIL
jgi:uncharacterized membrane protein YphA (DoxX/SURF4 family)